MGTRTHTYAIVDASTRGTVLTKRVLRRSQETDAFFLEGGHYKVRTASGPIDVEGPTWIVFDVDGCPYPVAPDVFERSWWVIG